jgi:hypothetical protein
MKTCLSLLLLGLLLSLPACTQVVTTGGTLVPIEANSEANAAGGAWEAGDTASLTKESVPADVLKRYQDANNSRDIAALMDCYDPEYIAFSQELGEGIGGGLADAFLGFSVDVDTSKMLPFLSKAFQKYVQSDDVYATLALLELSTTYQDADTATILYTEKVIAQDGAVQSENTLEMPVTRVDGVWYISMVDTLLSAFGN